MKNQLAFQSAIILCNPPLYCSDCSWLCHWCPWEATAAGRSELCEGVLVSVRMSWWHPCCELPVSSSTALRGVSEADLGASHSRVPAAVTITFLWLRWLLQSRGGCLAQLQRLSSWGGSFQCAEQRRGSAEACQASGEVSFSCRFTLLQASVLLNFAPLCSVCTSGGGSCWMVGHGL